MKTIVLVWAGLLALLAATAASSLIPLGIANAALNIGIAAAKAALVALFFMHLRRSIALLRLIAVVSLLALGLLFLLGGADLVTRHIERSAWQDARPSVSAGQH